MILSYKSFYKRCDEGKVDPLYIFYSDSDYLLKKATERLLDKAVDSAVREFNYLEVNGKDTCSAELIDFLDAMPIFTDWRVLLLKDADKMKKVEQNKLAEYFPKMLDSSVLIMTVEAVKKEKMPKAFVCKEIDDYVKENGQIVKFTLTEEECVAWVQQKFRQAGKKIHERDVNFFLKSLGTQNLSVLANEVEKLILFTANRNTVTQEDIKQISSYYFEGRVFDFIDQIGQKNVDSSLEIFDELLRAKEDPLKIMSYLQSHFRLLLQVKALEKENKTSKEISALLNQHPYRLSRCLRQLRNFSQPELCESIHLFLKTDESIKTGIQNIRLSLELLINKLCYKGGKR